MEAPMDQDRREAVFAETKPLIPNKPIRYEINTHHHFDHSGGLRAVGANDTIVITHESNFPFYERIDFDLRPRAIQPDRLSIAPRQVHYVRVKENYNLTAGDQDSDIYHATQLEHPADM